MAQWYVMRSKHRNEELLCHQLCSRGVEAYYPCTCCQRSTFMPRKVKPYFPGYLFIHTDLEKVGLSSLQWIPGAIGLVCFGGEPAYVSDSIVCGIRERVDQLNRKGGEVRPPMKAGEEIEIYSGPFTGYRGIFGFHLSDQERATVFLRFIRDQQIRVELPVTHIRGTKQYRTRL